MMLSAGDQQREGERKRWIKYREWGLIWIGEVVVVETS